MASLDSMIQQRLQQVKEANPQLAPGSAAMMLAMGSAPGSMPGVPPAETASSGGSAMVSVAVDGLPFRYQLAEADVQEMFQRWGAVKNVQIARIGAREVGIANFADSVDAVDAQRQLHGYPCVLDGRPATLAVVLGGPEPLMGGPRPVGGVVSPPTTVPPMGGGQPQASAAPQAAAMAKRMPMMDGQQGPPPQQPVMWNCRIYVQAERMHPEFPIALKIKGQDSANMNHIRQQANCAADLRGRGAGGFEPNGQEFPDAMHVQLSCMDAGSGKQTLDMLLDLLKTVYEEHDQWCRQYGIAPAGPLEATVCDGLSSSAPPQHPQPPQQPGAMSPGAGPPPMQQQMQQPIQPPQQAMPMQMQQMGMQQAMQPQMQMQQQFNPMMGGKGGEKAFFGKAFGGKNFVGKGPYN